MFITVFSGSQGEQETSKNMLLQKIFIKFFFQLLTLKLKYHFLFFLYCRPQLRHLHDLKKQNVFRRENDKKILVSKQTQLEITMSLKV